MTDSKIKFNIFCSKRSAPICLIFSFMQFMNLCSSHKVSQMSNNQINSNNTEHDVNDDHRTGLGRVLEDLDKCIERKSRLREENYLELCLQTEIGSIIFNIMKPDQEEKNIQGKESEMIPDDPETDIKSHFETNITNQIEPNRVKRIPKETTNDIQGKYVKQDNHNDAHRVKRQASQSNLYVADEPYVSQTNSSSNIHLKTNYIESIRQYDNLDITTATSKLGYAKKMISAENSTDEMFRSEYNTGNNNQTIGIDIIENNSTDIKHLNESKIEDIEPKIDQSLRRGRSLKLLLENVRNMVFSFMKIILVGNKDGAKGSFKTDHDNMNGTVVVNENKMAIRNDTEEELPKSRMANILQSTFEVLKDSVKYQVLKYLNQLLEYSRSIKKNGKEDSFWSLLSPGFTMVTRGRGKKDHKGVAVLSSLILLGVLVPVAFSAVALMAKKALISSLIALGLSLYSLHQHSKGAIQGKQSYEVEGPVAQPFHPSKYYGESKYNTPSSPGSDLPSAPSMPYSFPIDDTKYFNNRPTKQHSFEESTAHKYVAPHESNNDEIRTQIGKESSKGNYHNYEHNPSEQNHEYEVTEREEPVRRRPIRTEHKEKHFDQDKYSTNMGSDYYKPNNYDESRENQYRNVNRGRGPKKNDDGRREMETKCRNKEPTKLYGDSVGSTSNTYKNIDSTRKESGKRLNNVANGNVKNANDERYLKNYSSRFTNNDNVMSTNNIRGETFRSTLNEYSNTNYNDYTTTGYETVIANDNVYHIESAPTETNNFATNQFHTTGNNHGEIKDISEDVFKPMIPPTQLPKTYKNSVQLESIVKANENKDPSSYEVMSTRSYKETANEVKPFYTIEDNLLYQNLDEHEFKRPNPVYKPSNDETMSDGKSGVTLSYVSKIKNSVSSKTNASASSND